jgi:hypothetical protein
VSLYHKILSPERCPTITEVLNTVF